MYYRSIGETEAPTVLVVHGGPSDHRYLRVLADLVPLGYRVVWFDQLGCGRSSRPRSFDGGSMELYAEQIERVRRALRLGRVHLFGHSWGGALALQAAVAHPASFRTVVLSGGFASDASFLRAMRRHTRGLPASLRGPIERAARTGRYDRSSYRRAARLRQRQYSAGLAILPYDFELTVRAVNRRLMRAVYGDRPGLLAPLGGWLEGWDVTGRLARLRTPMLVVAGVLEAGRFTAREIARTARRAKLVLLPGSAHLPFFQDRDRFLSEVRRFLDAHERWSGDSRKAR